MSGPLAAVMKTQPLNPLKQAETDRSIREALAQILSHSKGSLLSSKVHADLKPWVATVIQVGEGDMTAPITFAEMHALDRFRKIFEQIKKDGKESGLPPRLIAEYEQNVALTVAYRVDHSREGNVLAAVREFGQKYGQSARDLRTLLVRKGYNIPSVKACIDKIDAYMKALSSLVSQDCSDTQYDPQMDLLLVELSKKDSPLRSSTDMFNLASDFCAVGWRVSPFNDAEVIPFINTANLLHKKSSAITGEILRMDSGRQLP